MAQKGEVYKCEICGNVVSVLEGGDGDLVCCGEDMRLLRIICKSFSYFYNLFPLTGRSVG